MKQDKEEAKEIIVFCVALICMLLNIWYKGLNNVNVFITMVFAFALGLLLWDD